MIKKISIITLIAITFSTLSCSQANEKKRNKVVSSMLQAPSGSVSSLVQSDLANIYQRRATVKKPSCCKGAPSRFRVNSVAVKEAK